MAGFLVSDQRVSGITALKLQSPDPLDQAPDCWECDGVWRILIHLNFKYIFFVVLGSY